MVVGVHFVQKLLNEHWEDLRGAGLFFKMDIEWSAASRFVLAHRVYPDIDDADKDTQTWPDSEGVMSTGHVPAHFPCPPPSLVQQEFDLLAKKDLKSVLLLPICQI